MCWGILGSVQVHAGIGISVGDSVSSQGERLETGAQPSLGLRTGKLNLCPEERDL